MRNPTVEQYADALHITVSRRGRLRDPIDDALEERGIRRQIVAAAPTSTAALSIISMGDFVVAVPARICHGMVQAMGLRQVPMPLRTPSVPIVGAWHQRYENDKAHKWLREQVRVALHEVCDLDADR
jgi:DNA-binding transcriptional LysR family regulator